MKFVIIIGVVAIIMATTFQLAASAIPSYWKTEVVLCNNEFSRCKGAHIGCPEECPSTKRLNAESKVCHVECDHPICNAGCRTRKPNCDAPGSACYDPRFVGGDGRVFYFHGKSNEVFTLVSDPNFQINGRFIGHRPAGRPRDFTWIQSLGILFNSHKLTVGASPTASWDNELDHLSFTYNGQNLHVAALSAWNSDEGEIRVERTSNKNSAVVTIKDKAEILVTAVPVTKQDDRVHKYNLPKHDCFAHLEVQFRFSDLSPGVEGVLGKTYRPEFENVVAKPGKAMPVMGGEDEYRTSELLSAECGACIFSETEEEQRSTKQGMMMGVVDQFLPTLDCGRGVGGGYGIVCRK